MQFVYAAVFVYLFATSNAQLAGNKTAETRPEMSIQKCTTGGCTKSTAYVTLDANWRWSHAESGSNNCYTGQTWDPTLCPSGKQCAQNCAVDGADYAGTYGINSDGNALTMKFVTNGPYSKNIGSRVYLMDSADKYQLFKLKNQEFSFDVDVGKIPCGMNGAAYLVEMDADGGMKRYPTNKAGAKYGTGYCDAQCPHDVKWIGGKANVAKWTPSASDPNSGTGAYGSCCAEMDLWEANSISQAFTPHTCSIKGAQVCLGKDCGDSPDNRYGGLCDKDGCDYASYRLGDKEFYGPKKAVDTSTKFTVITQFITSDGTANGDLSEIRRLYVQGGRVIKNSISTYPALKKTDSITDAFCKAEKTLFGDKNDFSAKGGLKSMGESMDRGMVFVMSLWNDHTAKMAWLDGTYPPNKEGPGVSRGTCDAPSGDPKFVETNFPDGQVQYSNLKFGDLHSTNPTTKTA